MLTEENEAALRRLTTADLEAVLDAQVVLVDGWLVTLCVGEVVNCLPAPGGELALPSRAIAKEEAARDQAPDAAVERLQDEPGNARGSNRSALRRRLRR